MRGKGQRVKQEDTDRQKWPPLIYQQSLQKAPFHEAFHVQMIEEARETISIQGDLDVAAK